MAIALTTTGNEISSENFFITATTDNSSVQSIQLQVYIEGYTGVLHTLEQGPDSGTTDEFTFEVNQVLKPYFEWAFHNLATTSAIDQENVLATLVFTEYDGTTIYSSNLYYLNLKNMTFSPLELNDLDLDEYDMSSGTGNKFLTSGPSELEVPDKRKFWASVLKAGTTATSPAVFSEVAALTYGYQDYLDIVDGGNGFMYLIPYNATDIIKLNPLTGAQTTVATGGLSGVSYIKGIKAANGKIYCPPFNETRVMVIDPSTDTVTFITGAGATNQKYVNAAEYNGVLYCAPAGLSAPVNILQIDTATDTITFDTTATYQGYGDAVAVGNIIYFLPINSNNVLKWNAITKVPSTQTLTNYGFYSSSFYHAASNTIYAIPTINPIGGQLVKIDGSTGVPSLFGPVIVSGDYVTATIGSDGIIYASGTTTNVLTLNMDTEATAVLSATAGTNYQGSDLFSTDGNIYAIPVDSVDGNVLKITMPTIGAAQELVVEAFNPTGISLGTTTYDIITTPRAPINPFAGSGGYGPSDVYDIWVQPITIDSASFQKTLQVWVRDKVSPFTIRSEVKTYINQNYGLDSCRGYRIHWLNEFGAQDSYTFNGRLRKVLETKSKDYQNVDLGTLVYFNEYAEQWEVTTLEESPSVVEWLTKMLRNKRAVLEQLVPNVNPAYFEIEILGADKQISDNLKPLTEFSLRFRFAKTSIGIQ